MNTEDNFEALIIGTGMAGSGGNEPGNRILHSHAV